jgi:hypothetical protein
MFAYLQMRLIIQLYIFAIEVNRSVVLELHVCNTLGCFFQRPGCVFYLALPGSGLLYSAYSTLLPYLYPRDQMVGACSNLFRFS